MNYLLPVMPAFVDRCNKKERLHALAVDEPLEYARLYLDGTMQMWVDTEDSLEL